ncbi:L-lactate dehydrogenase [Mitsuokella sp. oral taxon 131]|uniref:L-lactate dehydrogenase n=1 Tax=Mitsuokella sp. oral taxon 131 TaxID=1321780 RepID=UPI0003AD95A9|nr:L-lactate dehydrogenase [Mitsuokella sp. oral taxon 131]ERL03168.1 L-lactate dehydrogenase [Mitsuokella sp. oral taxon 131 str. W9106]
MNQRRKIVVIGASNVGSAVANKIADFQLATEVALIDINEDKAWGEAKDSSHATSCIYSTNIKFHLGDYDDCKDANIIVITAGPSIRPGETPDRLKLAGTNVKIMSSVFSEIVKRTKEAMIIMITNPLDVATYAVSTMFDYPRHLILGTGTLLETYRFRRILADRYQVDPKTIHGYVLGEHGNAAFVAWSTTGCAGFSIDLLDEYFHHTEKLSKAGVEKELVQVAYDVINRKGFTNTGVAMAACRYIKAVLYDEHTILPCSAVMEGEYGIKNVALSIPRMVCADGVVRSFEIHLSDDELEKMHKAAQSVRHALDGAGVK